MLQSPPSDLLTVPAAARYLSRSTHTIYRMIRDGKLRGVLIQEITHVERADLDRYLDPRPLS